MKVGKSRKDLTPYNQPFYLLGYKNPQRNHPAKGIHDPIFSNALLLDDGRERVFFWSADLLELPDTIAQDIKRHVCDTYNIEEDHILLSVMHNHSSVRDFHDDWEFGKFSKDYYDFFIQSILDSFAECENTLTTVHAKYGKDAITGYYSNRNHEGQLADNEVIVVKFFDEKNEPFAGIVNWAVHSTVLPANNMYLTGDLAGNTCQKLKAYFGFYPMFINGAAADCSNRNDRQGKDFDELERESAGLAKRISQIEVSKDIRLNGIHCICSKYRISTNMKSYHERLKETLQQIQNGELDSISMPKEHLIEKCEEQLRMQRHEETLTLEVLDVGDLRFFVFPGELGSKFGKELKASTKKVGLVAGYTNGFHYYFLPKEEYGKSFETIGNPVEPGIPEDIVCQLMDMSKSLD